MKQKAASRQRDLFDMDDYQTSPIPVQREQLAALVEALLREIAVALAAGEVGDDQDHGRPSRARSLHLHPPINARSTRAQPGEPAAPVRACRSRQAARLGHR